MDAVVVIIGAGPSGLATSACLNQHSIPNIILEREDCHASLWKKRSYDRVKLHLAKMFCQLPHMPYPPDTPTFISKKKFIQYLDDYVARFNLSPQYCRSVDMAMFDESVGKWTIIARNTVSNEVERYTSMFLVVATGENSEGNIPKIPGLDSFGGEIIHSSQYKSGSKYHEKNVLVVGCGNSGMEIAYDLTIFGAKTSIVVRSPFHVLTKELVYAGMFLLRILPLFLVDCLVLMLAKLMYGDLSKFGIKRPIQGPFYLKGVTGRSPVIDVGTVEMIRNKEIKVLQEISSVEGNKVVFEDGKAIEFDAIIFATGFRSLANNWLKDKGHLLDDTGMPSAPFPEHWKGKNGLYCAGLARRGLAGVSMDAQNIADDIKKTLSSTKKNL